MDGRLSIVSSIFSEPAVVELAGAAQQAIATAQLLALGVTARWLMLTSIVLLLGLFAFRLLIWNPILAGIEREPEEVQLDGDQALVSLRLGFVGLVLLAVALSLIFIDQSTGHNLLRPGNLQTWLGTRYGTVWLAQFLLGAAAAYLLVDLWRGLKNGRCQGSGPRWWAGLLLGLGLALTSSLTSQSAALTDGAPAATAVDLAHLLAAAVWAGGLLYLAVTLRLARRLGDESRTWLNLNLSLDFSSWGALAVGFLLATGAYLAWQHVGSWTALVGTAYGQALLVKIGLALPALGLAGVNLLVIKPRLNAAYDDAESGLSTAVLHRFRRLANLEAGLALLILLASGSLSALQRGQDAPLLTDAPGRAVLSQTAADLNVELTIEPALVGQNSFDVYLTGAGGEAVTDASKVSFRFTFLGQYIGATTAEAEPRGGGHYLLDGGYISLVGPWHVEVTVHRPGALETFAPFRLRAGLGGNIRPLGSGIRPLEQFANFMTLAGRLVTGAFLILFAVGWGFLAGRAAKSDWHLMALLAVSLAGFALGVSQLITFFGPEFNPARFVSNPILADMESVAVGHTLFQQKCVSCHGPEGRGDGPAASTLYPPPADFGGGHTASHPDGDLYFWIRQGIANTAMPAFGDELTREETWHLVNYVRRLHVQATVDEPQDPLEPILLPEVEEHTDGHH